jgi:hypothetical protein
LEVETLRAASLGREAMAGSKRDVTREVWQTIETSMGVMEMLRKPWWESSVRLRRSESRLEGWDWGRRVCRIGLRKIG